MKERIERVVTLIPGVTNLRAIPGAARIASVVWGWHGGFGGDRMYQKAVLACIDFFQVSAFVETGTHYGVTTGFVASHRRSLPVYSCEIDKRCYQAARASLDRYKNAFLFQQSSERCLSDLIARSRLGSRPLFFLDAHSGVSWPLREEMKIIASSQGQAIIVIDNFQVPGRDEFTWISYGDRRCNFELIKPVIDSRHTYSILYPAYSRQEAYGREVGELVGRAMIFQNLEAELKPFADESFINRYFHLERVVVPGA